MKNTIIVSFIKQCVPLLFCLLSLICQNAEAIKIKKKVSLTPQISKAIHLVGNTVGHYDRSPPAKLVVDVKTGQILESQNAKTSIYPASTTKLMTAYLVFEALDSGKLSMEDKIPVSSRAAHVIPLKLGLRPGQQITVRDALNGTIIHSANDASIALAEKIAGSEDKFAVLMTKRARSLGMKDTSFTNAAGFHHNNHKTTAIDLAKLAMAVERDFPDYAPLFRKNSFQFEGRTIKGHNRVTENYEGVRLGKTGFHNAAGCNLVTIVERKGKTVVALVTGSKPAASRNLTMTTLLDKHLGIITPQKSAKTQSLHLVKNKVIKKNSKSKRMKRSTSI